MIEKIKEKAIIDGLKQAMIDRMLSLNTHEAHIRGRIGDYDDYRWKNDLSYDKGIKDTILTMSNELEEALEIYEEIVKIKKGT